MHLYEYSYTVLVIYTINVCLKRVFVWLLGYIYQLPGNRCYLSVNYITWTAVTARN